MYVNLHSSCGNTDSTDHSVDNEVDDMFVTASGRFIVPTSTLPCIRNSLNSVGMSSFSLGSTPDSPSIPAAVASKHFHLETTNFEMCDDDTQSTEVYKQDGEEVTQPSQHDLSTSGLPSMPCKVSPFMYIDCSSKGMLT